MNHKWNTFERCEYCGVIKSSSNAQQECISQDSYDDGLVSAATMATFTSLFESATDTSSSSDDFSGGGGGDFGGGGSSGDV